MSEYDKILEESGLTEKEIMEFSMMLEDAMQALPKSLGKPDWTYKDLPRMYAHVKDEFIQLVGEENIEWITFATYDDGSCCGKVILSPTAMAAIEKMATNPSVN